MIDYLPWFQLSDPYVTREMTVRDLLVHRSGLGLGAGLAGLTGPDPGEGFATGSPHALVQFGLQKFPLWHVEVPGAAAFAGEAPSSTWLQVERLFHPAQLLEISGIAVLG